MPPLLVILVAVVLALVVEIFVATLVHRAVRRSPLAVAVVDVSRRPLRVTLVAAAAWIALGASADPTPTVLVLEALLLAALILALAWLLTAVVLRLEDAALAHHQAVAFDARGQDETGFDPHALALQTRVRSLLRGATRVALGCAGAGAALLVFPVVRPVGVGLLGLVAVAAVVLALAARELLADVVAGVRLAYTDAVRVGDVVVLDGEWGLVEAVALTTLTVRLGEERHVPLPASQVATGRFENRTRGAAEVVGEVALDVPRDVGLQTMRDQLQQVLDGTPLWDGHVARLRVLDAVGANVRVRAEASAADGPSLLALREHVRESLVGWLSAAYPQTVGVGAGAWAAGTTASRTTASRATASSATTSSATTSTAWRQTAAAIATPTTSRSTPREPVAQLAVEPPPAQPGPAAHTGPAPQPSPAHQPDPAHQPGPEQAQPAESRLPVRRSAVPRAAAAPAPQAPAPDQWLGGGAAPDQTQVYSPAQLAGLYDQDPRAAADDETQVLDSAVFERRSSRRELRDY